MPKKSDGQLAMTFSCSASPALPAISVTDRGCGESASPAAAYPSRQQRSPNSKASERAGQFERAALRHTLCYGPRLWRVRESSRSVSVRQRRPPNSKPPERAGQFERAAAGAVPEPRSVRS
jgi:hypothetical protein